MTWHLAGPLPVAEVSRSSLVSGISPEPEVRLHLVMDHRRPQLHLQLKPPSSKEASNPGPSSSSAPSCPPGFPFHGAKIGVKPAADQGTSDSLRSTAGHLAPIPDLLDMSAVMREADISLPVKGFLLGHGRGCRRVHLSCCSLSQKGSDDSLSLR